MNLVLLFIAIIASFHSVEYVDSAVIEPIVTLAQGKLKGVVQESRNGRNYVEYLGIPYVKKPERFQEATAPQNWEGLRDGSKFGSVCPQFDRKSKMVIGNEDCSFLNVYTPAEMPKQVAVTTSGTKTASSTTTTPVPALITKRPVIVYIGSQSSDLFGPKYLVDDVLLVTFNYRLSVFGFLSTGDKETVANLALRDQIAALKWVHQNIAVFGGDPTRVTLFGGGSAGGAMASYLSLSPLAKGLFSNVISTSGNSLCGWAVVRNPGKIAAKLATKLNCPNTKTSKDIVSCIKSKSIKDIEIARVSLQGFTEDPAVPFAPVVETWLSKDTTATAVIPEAPEKLLAEGKFARIPWLTGVNSLNGVNLAVANILTTPKRLAQLDKDWNKLAPTMFHFSQTAPNPGNVSDEIREHYFAKKNISLETKDRLISALTDRNFIHCTAKAASMYAKYSPVYLYNLNYIGAASFLDDWGVRDKLDLKGVVHGDELQHLFNLKLESFPLLKKGDKHYPFSEKMVKLFTSFAKNGKPMESTDKAGAEWSPVQANLPRAVLEWYSLDSLSLSRPIVFDESRQSTLWDSLDLGEALPSSKNNPKFAVGYEMPLLHLKGSNPSPITPTHATGTKPIPGSKPLSTANLPLTPLKPQASSNSKPAPLSQYSVGDIPAFKPTQEKSSVTPTASSVSVTQKPSSVAPIVTQATPKAVTNNDPPFVISAIFKDEPYSSTTTTTTKKPGFFSKIIG